MAAESFAKLIISKLNESVGNDGTKYDKNTPNTANRAISEAITEYLIDNTTIILGYIGATTTSPPVPDPVISDIAGIEGECKLIEGITFESWISSLEINLRTGFTITDGKLGVAPKIPTFAFTLTPKLIITQDQLKSAQEKDYNDSQLNVWVVITKAIIDWIESTLPIVYLAERNSFNSIGTATTVTITVK